MPILLCIVVRQIIGCQQQLNPYAKVQFFPEKINMQNKFLKIKFLTPFQKRFIYMSFVILCLAPHTNITSKMHNLSQLITVLSEVVVTYKSVHLNDCPSTWQNRVSFAPCQQSQILEDTVQINYLHIVTSPQIYLSNFQIYPK